MKCGEPLGKGCSSFLFLAVSGVPVWAAQHCQLPLHCWAGQCFWGSSGQHGTTVRWLLLLSLLFVCFFVCLLLMFAVHNMTGSTVSFYFSVVLTAVPLQLDVERWVCNIVQLDPSPTPSCRFYIRTHTHTPQWFTWLSSELDATSNGGTHSSHRTGLLHWSPPPTGRQAQN